ncbi:hypothetical protein [Parvimonas parva]|uniref:hypothetical protein n=1 Tax=Parvimonas parva TaxID=2769485 RepID=UPI0038B23CAF
MKKLSKIAMFLIVIMLINFTNTILAHEEVNGLNIIYSNHSEDSYRELIEYKNCKYYFEDTKKYTISITYNKDNGFIIDLKDKLDNTISNTKIIKNYYNDDVFLEIRDSVLSKNIVFMEVEKIRDTNIGDKLSKEMKKVTFDDSISKNKYLSGGSDPIDDEEYKDYIKAYNELVEEYGTPYRQKYLSSLIYKGHKAELFQNKTFQIYPETTESKLFAAGTLIGVVASFLSVPESVILIICSVVSNALGLWALAFGYKPKVMTADVNYGKEIKVYNYWPYRSDKINHGRVLIGDRNGAYVYRNTWKNNDYEYDENLMKKAIDNYLRIVN